MPLAESLGVGTGASKKRKPKTTAPIDAPIQIPGSGALVESKRAEWDAWSSVPEDVRGRMPFVGTTPLQTWLNNNDPKRHYFEDGGQIRQEKYEKMQKAAALRTALLKKTTRGRSDRLYDRAASKSGLSGEAPEIAFRSGYGENWPWIREGTPEAAPAAAFAPWNKNKVVMNTAGLQGMDPARSKNLLLHEFAHTGQDPSSDPVAVEGLAERFARLMTKKLDIPTSPVSEAYQGYTQKAKKRYSLRETLFGQFR